MINVARTVEDMARAIRSGVCYISGPISGVLNYKENFAEAESLLFGAGMIAINPAYMPEGLPYDDYFPTCYAQIGISNALCFLPGYDKRTGAAREAKRAQWNRKEYWAFTLEQFLFYRDFIVQSRVAERVPENDKEKQLSHVKDAKEGLRISGDLLAEWLEKINPPRTERQKQNDKVKRVLRSYRYCLQQIDAACDEIERLDSRRKRITVQHRDVHGHGGSDYAEVVIDNIQNLERGIEEHTKQLEAERKMVQFWIDSLDDYREQNVLGLCYLNGLQFEQIAEILNYDYGYVRKLHGRAVSKLQEIMTEVNKQ